ncbi:hypothetical protein [Psychromonas ossibalaenae]|uniref:hypothetical protein n=1 Tax=Psychromonas ossibalaenae TaxID=444922 RepID=UPI00036363F9|nr:hypothetical protein [Psychromonas ossibalaenae]
MDGSDLMIIDTQDTQTNKLHIKTNKLHIETNKLRECRFYWWYIKKDNPNHSEEPTTAAGYREQINVFISSRLAVSEDIENNINIMKQTAAYSLLGDDELKWIGKHQERLCYWIWSYCRLADMNKPRRWEGEIDINLDQNLSFQDNIYESLQLNKTPLSASERYGLIIKFLDLCGLEISQKRSLLKYWKETWGSIYGTERFIWLDNKNAKQCEWAWDYLSKNKDLNIPHWFIPVPTTAQQMYDATITAFDTFSAHIDTKKMFMIKMKKAWSQKKHRDSMEGKKAYNFVLKNEVKEKLDKLAKANGLKKNEYLEQIINQEFNNI